MAEYPNAIWSPREVENRPGRTFDANDKRFFYAEDYLFPAQEIEAIETILGLNPEGAFNTVAERLDSISGGSPAGSSGQFQYNNGGAFGGARLGYNESGSLNYIRATNSNGSAILQGVGTGLAQISVQNTANFVTVNSSNVELGQVDGLYRFRTNPMFFSSVGILDFSNLGQTRTFDFPNHSGTVIVGDAGLGYDSANEWLGVGTDTPGTTLDVRGGAVFNEDGLDVDFRIESSSKVNAFFLRGSDGFVGIGSDDVDSPLHLFHSSSNTGTPVLADLAFSYRNISNTDGAVSYISFQDSGGFGVAQLGAKYTDQSNHYGELLFLTKRVGVSAERARIDSFGNFLLGGSTIGTGSTKSIHIFNSNAPTASVAGGGILYVENGALKYRGAGGTVTTLGNS